jgi:hypothetical protein
MIFENLCKVQRIVLACVLGFLLSMILLFFIPKEEIKFDDFNSIEWTNITEREINLRSMVSWQLSKQLQSVALIVTMFISGIGVISRNLNIQSDDEANFYLKIILILNIFFNIGISWFLRTYSNIAQFENQINSELSIILRETAPLFSFILNDDSLLVRNFRIVIIATIINSIWLYFSHYKIKIELYKKNCASSRREHSSGSSL